MGRNISRRALLRAGSAATGTAVLGSFAGCAQLDQSTGGGGGANGQATGTADATETTTSNDDATETDESSGPYRQWLPEPDVVVDDGHYYFEYVDYDDLRNYEDTLHPSVYNSYADPFSEVNPSLDRVDGGIIISPFSDGETPSVVTGSFTAAEVSARLAEFDFERVEDLGDYAVYMGEGAIAVRDGTVLYANETSTDPLETLIDTRAGEVTRYTEASDTLASLLGRFANGTFVYGETGEVVPAEDADPSDGTFAGQVGTAYEDSVGPETTNVQIEYAFDEAGDIDMDAVSEYTDSGLFDAYDSVDTERQGRLVVITGAVPTSDLYA